MDILCYAINMEKEGEKYYREQAELNHENGLYTVFTSLGNDESNHAKILEDKSKVLFHQLKNAVQTSAKNIFAGLPDFKMDIKRIPEQLDIYRMALEMEKQSIELYKRLQSESPEDADIYEYLVSQEEEHYKIIEEIVKIVNRPNEWVEAAEFGIREQY